MLPTRESVIAAVTDLVAREHAGNWELAYSFADTDRDGKLDISELSAVLKRAGFGALTRGAIVRGILQEVDADRDDKVTLEEFMTVFQPTPTVES